MGTGLTRRTFVELGAAGVVLAATGGLTSSHAAAASGTSQGRRRRDDVGVETDIAELQRLMALGQLSSEELTESYLDRIKRLNPTLNAVIETTLAKDRDFLVWRAGAEAGAASDSVEPASATPVRERPVR